MFSHTPVEKRLLGLEVWVEYRQQWYRPRDFYFFVLQFSRLDKDNFVAQFSQQSGLEIQLKSCTRMIMGKTK